MENLHPATEKVRQFDAEHGDSIREGNWFYFEDGAAREAMMGGFGALMPPDANPRERYRIIVHYHKLKLQRLMYEFDPLADELQAMLKQPYVDAHLFDAKASRAEDLQAQIDRQKKRLDQAQEEQRKHEPGYRTREQDAASQAAIEAERQRQQDRLQKLKV